MTMRLPQVHALAQLLFLGLAIETQTVRRSKREETRFFPFFAIPTNVELRPCIIRHQSGARIPALTFQSGSADGNPQQHDVVHIVRGLADREIGIVERIGVLTLGAFWSGRW